MRGSYTGKLSRDGRRPPNSVGWVARRQSVRSNRQSGHRWPRSGFAMTNNSSESIGYPCGTVKIPFTERTQTGHQAQSADRRRRRPVGRGGQWRQHRGYAPAAGNEGEHAAPLPTEPDFNLCLDRGITSTTCGRRRRSTAARLISP